VRAVDVYTHSLAVDPLRLAELARWLSPDEDLRKKRFRFPKDQQHFAAGRGILRETLARYLGADPSEIEFTYNRFGKPALRDSDLHFNVSHSAGLAVYAISRSREVGVDIERIDPKFAEDQIAERFFSPSEVAALRSLRADLQTEAFFRCWTRKEAYVKARGSGLSLPLDTFDVTLRPGQPAAFLRGVEGWSIEDLETAPGYVAALVAEDNEAENNVAEDQVAEGPLR